MIDQLKAKLPHDEGCAAKHHFYSDWKIVVMFQSTRPCNCTRREILDRAENLEALAKAFTAWHDHPDVTSHTYETAYTEMVMAWRKLL